MAYIPPYKIHPLRAWTLEETKIPQRAWTLEESKIPHRPNSASRAPRRDFRGAVVVNPSFQRFNEPVDSMLEEDMEPQLMEAPPVQHGPRRVAIKRENINVVRECEWDVKSIKDDNFRTKTSLGKPLVALLGVVCITSFVSLLLTLLILFGYVGTKNCSCGGKQGGSTDAMKSVDDDRIVKVSENITTLDKKLVGRILQVEQRNEEKENMLVEETKKLRRLLQQQENATVEEKLSQEKKFKNLTDRLESTQRELTLLKARLVGQTAGLWNATNSTIVQLNQLKRVWNAVNATAEETSNLTKKIDLQFNNVWRSVNGSNATLRELVSSLQVLKLKVNNEMETVWLNLNQSSKCCTNLKSSLQSLRENVTYCSERLEARIKIEEHKSNNTHQVMEQHLKKIQDLDNLLNSTRQDANEVSRQYLTALWSAENFTKRELHRVWSEVNATQIGLEKTLMKVKKNLTEQLNQTTVLLESLDSSLLASLINVNASITEKVNNVTKMAGPIGPPGFNGSQGPAGPAGYIGSPGPKGAGDFSACQYQVKNDVFTGGSTVEIIVGLLEPNGKRILGASCSTNFAAEYNLLSISDNTGRRYSCICKGTSTLFGPIGGQQKTCYLHYWECPLTT